jgi:hypothetical protein
VITATIAAVQAIVLLAYGLSIAIVALTVGIQGPRDVASPGGVAVETVVFVLFGIGLGFVAAGRWRGASWSTVPFVVAQLLALPVGLPLLGASGWPRVAGIATVMAAVAGLVAVVAARVQDPAPTLDVRQGRPAGDPQRKAQH